MKRYYLASGLENAPMVKRLHKSMQKAGWTCSYDWTAHGSVQAQGDQVIAKVAADEAMGVVSCDVVIVLMPGGRGTHVELGMALALGRPVVLVGSKGVITRASKQVCAFYLHPSITRRVFVDIAVGCERVWLVKHLPAEAGRACRTIIAKPDPFDASRAVAELEELHPLGEWSHRRGVITAAHMLTAPLTVRRTKGAFIADAAGFDATSTNPIAAVEALLTIVAASDAGHRIRSNARGGLRRHRAGPVREVITFQAPRASEILTP